MRLDKVWKFKPYDEKVVLKIQEDLKISRAFCQLLAQRGIQDYESARQFFRPDINCLHDPFLMKGMHTAVDCIDQYIRSGKKIMVFGDYDVDGTTAVATVYDFLLQHAPSANRAEQLCYYIPHRYTEGYGLSDKAIDICAEKGIALIITLDCGIKSVDKIARAKSMGIDIIVCDHHLPDEDSLPDAKAILNPKQKDCPYPYKELSGCGIGFKLISALSQKWDLPFEHIAEYLDLVATSIAADIVPIDGENRTLAYFGMQKVNTKPCLAIKVIKDLIQSKDIFQISDLVFSIAPRINAAGRMDDGNKAVALFIEKDEARARTLAEGLQSDNSDRREVDKSISDEALLIMKEEHEVNQLFSSVVFRPHWHKGVVGIVASRLVDHYYKPTIVLTESNEKITGSARSVVGFNIHDAIAACSDLLENFGGHYFAAGLTMPKENFGLFKERFEQFVKSTITDISLLPQILIDSEIDLAQINSNFYSILKQFEPFGPENMRPVFYTKGVSNYRNESRIVKDQHIKFSVCQTDSKRIDGIGFNLAHKFDLINSGQPFDMVYTIEENEWRGMQTLQIKVLDLKAQAS
ncbi:MAG: single-stranded-DNA-specific exonuclease RecJ [Sphingobacteriales bacterium]|nr:MAG: single-stranded-DNA-specific exonuclease RecJ [Sphingobacteriales bacterium]